MFAKQLPYQFVNIGAEASKLDTHLSHHYENEMYDIFVDVVNLSATVPFYVNLPFSKRKRKIVQCNDIHKIVF